ncbi:toll/interleukin-1 receptor domain-containing protein [Brevibacillus halotolerans]|uniref:toll/interleukin-1 receptor domain-containing protein n=1 Tax=Brevibacillus halotolerans TaxID=1507437 RepID=UPI0015EFD47A|nr:toll/interleukin-1 receptor domain-containing protein [Brevibacillus halotolerans]MBA4533137.1 toll/interleukin-1 receptor domain-containing protein [Brevibacillus halotolerans]
MRTVLIFESSNKIDFGFNGHEEWHSTDGLSIDFLIKGDVLERERIDKVVYMSKFVDWISVEGKNFFFNLDKIREINPIFNNCVWLQGIIQLEPKFDKSMEGDLLVCFSASIKEIELNFPQKIFLSHRGIDKPIVREFYKLLIELGYEPWLDEEDMAAGTKLHRGILQGMKESCAAVFFITPNYVDDGYLEIEIDYAVEQKRKKKDKFSMIMLSLPDETGKRGEIPELLSSYVWKTPNSHLEAFKEIIKALPLKNGTKLWKNK